MTADRKGRTHLVASQDLLAASRPSCSLRLQTPLEDTQVLWQPPLMRPAPLHGTGRWFTPNAEKHRLPGPHFPYDLGSRCVCVWQSCSGTLLCVPHIHGPPTGENQLTVSSRGLPRVGRWRAARHHARQLRGRYALSIVRITRRNHAPLDPFVVGSPSRTPSEAA